MAKSRLIAIGTVNAANESSDIQGVLTSDTAISADDNYTGVEKSITKSDSNIKTAGYSQKNTFTQLNELN